jgi:NTP pyrophosphatase (non-canonical NTP hydrolase)
MANFGLGVSGEGGEVANKIKKMLFHGHPLDTDIIADELGDVLWYVAALCTTMNIDLSQVMRDNIAKVMRRYEEGFSEEASRARKE